MSEAFKIIKNFGKVLGVSLAQPTKILTLGIGVGLSFLFPPASIPLTVLAIGTVGVMTFSDLSNNDFVNQILKPQSYNYNELSAIQIIEQQLKNLTLFAEVREDLLLARDTLLKIDELAKKYPLEESGAISFTKQYGIKLAERLVNLSDLEQRARIYISQENLPELEKRKAAIDTQIESITDDPVAKNELTEALKLLDNRIKLFNTVKKRIARIDSYLIRINATLESAYGQLTRISLKDSASVIDENKILSESLKQMVSDVETFEAQNIEIASAISETTEEKDRTPVEVRV